MDLKYSEPQPIERSDVLRTLASGSVDAAVEALIRMAYWEEEFTWAEETCFTALSDPRAKMRNAGLTGLGLLVRRFRKVDRRKVLPAVNALLNDHECAGIASDTLDDIAVFVEKAEE